jgi:putative endonuclease
MFFTYILLSRKDLKFYIGYTDNLKKRFIEHQEGKVEATKWRRPLKLVYYEACLSKRLAFKREKYFKTGFGRRFLKTRIGLNKSFF